jgi:hypothetical protein
MVGGARITTQPACAMHAVDSTVEAPPTVLGDGEDKHLPFRLNLHAQASKVARRFACTGWT